MQAAPVNPVSPHGVALDGGLRTWTGRIVNRAQWALLSDWERHGSTVDGLDYERKLRGEWPDVPDLSVTKKKHRAA